MDFRMDKASWLMLFFILVTFMYYLVQGAGSGLETVQYIQLAGFALLCTVVVVALASIPVIIICYFIKKIPDIDYSIWAATIFTFIGIITELA